MLFPQDHFLHRWDNCGDMFPDTGAVMRADTERPYSTNSGCKGLPRHCGVITRWARGWNDLCSRLTCLFMGCLFAPVLPYGVGALQRSVCQLCSHPRSPTKTQRDGRFYSTSWGRPLRSSTKTTLWYWRELEGERTRHGGRRRGKEEMRQGWKKTRLKQWSTKESLAEDRIIGGDGG